MVHRLPVGRITSRPAPFISAIGAVVGIGMLIVGLTFFGNGPSGSGSSAFAVLWVVVCVAMVVYHVANAVRPKGVPTEVIDVSGAEPQLRTRAERLEELEDLRRRALITDAEYAAKRAAILAEV